MIGCLPQGKLFTENCIRDIMELKEDEYIVLLQINNNAIKGGCSYDVR